MKNFDKLKAKFKGNTIALGNYELADSPDIPVERDASGIPVAWRIFKIGANSMTKNGVEYLLNFTPEVFDQIIAYYTEKGEKIPLDSSHFLYKLAEKLKVDESEVLKFLPDGRGTFGFAALQLRADGLWVTDVEYVPIARQLMAEGILRWFSPVLRGLLDGRLRITSVTFENEPALNNIDAIAASAESSYCGITEIQSKLDALAASANIETNNQKKEKEVMKKLLPVLAALIAMDSISMGADGEAPEGVIEKLKNLKPELDGLRATKAKTIAFIGAVRDPLALGAEADLNAVEGRVLGIVEKAKTADGLKLRVDALELSAETEKLDKLKTKGKTEGKLTEAMLASEWLKKQDSVALAAFLEVTPVVVPGGHVDPKNLGNPDAIALSAEDIDYCVKNGYDQKAFLEEKKKQSKK
jgi:hypothetical protein